MAFFRNLSSTPARAWAFVGAGAWREYECAPGATIEVADSDAPVFRGQPGIFAEVDGLPEPETEPAMSEAAPAAQPAEPEPAPSPAPKLAQPVRRRR